MQLLSNLSTTRYRYYATNSYLEEDMMVDNIIGHTFAKKRRRRNRTQNVVTTTETQLPPPNPEDEHGYIDVPLTVDPNLSPEQRATLWQQAEQIEQVLARFRIAQANEAQPSTPSTAARHNTNPVSMSTSSPASSSGYNNPVSTGEIPTSVFHTEPTVREKRLSPASQQNRLRPIVEEPAEEARLVSEEAEIAQLIAQLEDSDSDVELNLLQDPAYRNRLLHTLRDRPSTYSTSSASSVSVWDRIRQCLDRYLREFPNRDVCYNRWYAGFMEIGFIPPSYAMNLSSTTLPIRIPWVTRGFTLRQIRVLQVIAACTGVAVAVVCRIRLRHVGVRPAGANLGPHGHSGHEYAFSSEAPAESSSHRNHDMEQERLLQTGVTGVEIATEITADTIFRPDVAVLVISDRFQTVVISCLRAYFRSRQFENTPEDS